MSGHFLYSPLQVYWPVCRRAFVISMPIDNRSTPSSPLGPLGKCRESSVVGQVAMVTDQGGGRTAQTSGMGCPIGERPLGPPREDAKGAQAGCPLPRTPQMVGEAKEGGTNGARFHCQVAAQSTVLKYCELQHRVALGGPCSFAGPSLVCEAIATLEVMWKDV